MEKGGRDVALKPLRTGLVRLRYFKKGAAKGADEEYRRFGKLYKRLYLLALTPDALQLYTTKDAAEAVAGEGDDKPGCGVEAGPSLKSSFSSFVKSPLRKMMTGKRMEGALASPTDGSGSGGGEEEPLRPQASGGSDAGGGQTDLDDDQVFTISVSLNQIVSLTQEGRCLKVAYRPNKPKRHRTQEDTITFMKGLLFPLWYPVEAMMRDNWKLDTFMENHMRKDPTVHTFLIEAADATEAGGLRAAVEGAMERLLQALLWLSKDLPLLDRSSISMVSMDCPEEAEALGGAAGPQGRGAGGGGSGKGQSPALSRTSSRGNQAVGQEGGCVPTGAAHLGQRQVVVATYPAFGDRIPLPEGVSTDVAASAGSGGGGGGGSAVLHVWLHTPLGPARAEIVPARLLEDPEVAAGCPFTLQAQPTAKDASGKAVHPSLTGLQGGKHRVVVLLRCALTRGEELPLAPSPAAAGAGTTLKEPPRQGQSGGSEPLLGLLRRRSQGLLTGLLAIMAVLLVILANYTQLPDQSRSTAVGVLRSVSFLVSSLAGVVAIGATAVRFKSGGGSEGGGRALTRPGPSSQALAAHPLRYRWVLELMEADLVESGAQEGAAPRVLRSLSVTGGAPGKGEAPPAPGKELPMPIQRLIEQHPGLVNVNVAERFLIGWGTPSSAYGGLVDMIDWMKQQGLEGVVSHAQPRFELVKKHYRHGVFGRSKADCPVEIECMGTWKAAYDAMRKDGVTEQELLHHLVFTYEYTFSVVDPRPLPHGQTVKIVDLEGLCMGDLRSDAVKFLTKVGALLNMAFPQRLHRCFLVNAPTWWAVVWRMVSPMIAKKTREQMFLFSKTDQEGMRRAILEEVSPDQLPVEYGGTCTTPLYESKYEKELLEHVRKVNAEAVEAKKGAGAGGGQGLGQVVSSRRRSLGRAPSAKPQLAPAASKKEV